ncbi:MAG: diacylglycerol/lipid kinase family protein [Acidimicrobiales bacterium]
MRQALFVINPAVVRRLSALLTHCYQAAETHGWQAELIVTQAGEGSAELHGHLSWYLSQPGDKLVVSVGGDGTVRACAHDLAGTATPLAVVPRGTANLFAHALGVPRSLKAALAIAFGDHERQVDLGFSQGQPFVAMAGIGIDAAVVESTPRWFKQNLGWLGYALAALPHLADPAHELSVSLDGGEPLERRGHAVVVGNVGILPGGFTLLPGARLDDGLLEVGVLAPYNLAGWLPVARSAVTGRPTAGGRVEHLRAARVEITSFSPLPRQFDGDVVGPSRSLSVCVRRKALAVRAPAGPLG